MSDLQGRCLCGGITYTCPPPARFDVCHCDDCRRWHGTSPVGVDGAHVTLTDGADPLRWYEGPTGAGRGFCGRCGSSLFYRYAAGSMRWSVYLGSLQDVPPSIPLGPQHFTRQRPAQYEISSRRPGLFR